MTTRMQFLQPSDDTIERIELFVLPPKFKKDKDRGRIATVIFSHKLVANTANLCDEKVRRAFEDCEFLEREIEHVELSSMIENTNIDFYMLPAAADSPAAREKALEVRNATVFGLYVERRKSETYLYFGFEVVLASHASIAHFFVDHFGYAIFAEFSASQHALTQKQQADGAAAALPFDGITSMTMQVGDDPRVELDVSKMQKLAQEGEAAQ